MDDTNHHENEQIRILLRDIAQRVDVLSAVAFRGKRDESLSRLTMKMHNAMVDYRKENNMKRTIEQADNYMKELTT